ncbi:ABC transporter substrate-binding protein [Paenibacillus gansuensis]|uniref:ABC transporter substrate-binding protein n=1 Tax=Paenibacillus gansuensis TaxID=306542 RepID=A0ABW5PF25_9BACL
MWRRMLGMLLVLATVITAAACSGSTTETAGGNNGSQKGNAAVSEGTDAGGTSGGVDRNADIKIKVLTHFTDEARRNLLNDAITKFKEQWPNAEVIDETTTEYGTKMKLEFASGDGPDFVTVDDLMQQTLNQGKYLKDITELVKKNGYIEKSVPGAVEFNNLRTPGTFYSVPILMAPVALFYNKDILEEFGVTSPPQTLEQFEEILEKAKQAGYIPLANAGQSNNNMLWMIYHLVFNNTPIEDVRKWYYQESTPESVKKGFTDAFAKVAEWTKKGYLGDPKVMMGVGYDNYISNLYAQGKVAMALDGDWAMASFVDSGINTGVFAFPSEYIVNASDSGWALNAQADETKTAAFEDFVNIFFTEEMTGKLYTAGYTPSVLFDESKLEAIPLKQELQKAVADKKMGYFLDNAVPGLYDAAQKITQQLYMGKLTPEQTWEQFQAAYDKGLTK